MPILCEQLLLDLEYAAPQAPPNPRAPAATVEPSFAERHDDPAQAEELERQQDA